MNSINCKVTNPRMSPHQRGLIFVTTATLAWSTAGLFTRLIPLDSATLLVWRGAFGFLAIALLILIIDKKNPLAACLSLSRIEFLFACISAIGMLFFISSFAHTTVAHVSIIYATVPFVAAALAWLALRERPTFSAVTASAVALIGVAIMVGVSEEGGWFGDMLAVGMTVCLALMMIMSRKFPQMPIMPAACVSTLMSSIVAIPFSEPLSVNSEQLVLLLCFGVVNSALGLSLFVLGSRYLPAIECALVTALDAPLAPVWVWLWFAETPGNATLLGGTIVFLAVAAHLRYQPMH